MINVTTSGTILLATGLSYTGDQALTINGNELVIDAQASTRALEVTGGATVTLIDLAFRNGTSPAGLGGAAVRTDGNLVVSGSTFSDNVTGGGGAGAIAAVGSVTVSDSTFERNVGTDNALGGAITSGATVSISTSRFMDNSTGGSGVGGAVHAVTGIEVADSTFSGNTSTYGSVLGSPGSITIERSTFVGNGAATGVVPLRTVAANGQVIVRNSTFSANISMTGTEVGPRSGNVVSGIELDHVTMVDGVATVQATSILASGANVSVRGSVLWSAGQSVCASAPSGSYQSSQSYFLSGGCGTEGPGVVLAEANPQLAPLADNGGPTQTRLPLDGSPLLDVIPLGDEACGGSDQRSTARPQGPGCEIGSVEIFVAPPPTTTTTTAAPTATTAAPTTTSPTSPTPTATPTTAGPRVLAFTGRSAQPLTATGFVLILLGVGTLAASAHRHPQRQGNGRRR